MTLSGPIVMCCAPEDRRTPNEVLPTTVPLSVTPIRLRAIVESWVPLSTRIPPHWELTITLSVTVECDASGGHGRVVLQVGVPSSRTPTSSVIVCGLAEFPVG